MAVQVWRGRWDSLPVRDRRALLLAIAVVLAGLAWWLGFDRPMAARERLARSLPELQTQRAEVAALAQRAQRLKSTADAAQATPASEAGLMASLERAGIKASVASTPEQRWLVKGQDQAAARVLLWLDEARRDLHLSPSSVRLQRSPSNAQAFEFEVQFERGGRP